jgi:hypothetical protein
MAHGWGNGGPPSHFESGRVDGVIASSDGDWAEIYPRSAVIVTVRVLSFSIRLHQPYQTSSTLLLSAFEIFAISRACPAN